MEGVNTGSFSSTLAKFTIENGFLCYKKRITLSPESEWRDKLMAEYHSTPAGHQGVVKTYHRSKKMFYWQGMKKNI